MPRFKRIVTFMDHKPLPSDPLDILIGGSGTMIYRGKQRVFAVREIVCDEKFNMLYSKFPYVERRYLSLQELKSNYKGNKRIFRAPILDNDHKLNVWKDEDNTYR